MNYLQQNYMQPNMYQPQGRIMGNYEDHLALSIFNFFCCCFWLGIPALIFSCQARDHYMNGDIEKGSSSARIAQVFNIIGITIGAIAAIIFIILLSIGASVIYSS